jgi:hypothetical protein
MPPSSDRLIDRLAEGRTLKIWQRAADAAATADLASLRTMRSRARRTQRELDRLIATAESRLALPHVGSNAMHRPLGADWLWRPEPWRLPVSPRGLAGLDRRTDFAAGVALFHDCPLSEIAFRQERNSRPGDLAPFGLTLEILGFEGSFLSLALDLPPGASDGLLRRHILAAEIDIEAERPLQVTARLNVKHGPNTEELPVGVSLGGGPIVAEFDLAYSKVNEKRVEKIWVDLIFSNPSHNAIRLRDLTMSRRPRAEI